MLHHARVSEFPVLQTGLPSVHAAARDLAAAEIDQLVDKVLPAEPWQVRARDAPTIVRQNIVLCAAELVGVERAGVFLLLQQDIAERHVVPTQPQ
eukprot:CAMPEP_0175165626 /NCGR_PEP_ID=MMETSP0087-20121206/27202_1 /TAXON_ID=136419 /ORGANISM="Unknown Unknown, Strain D1" /LENGTH=94 /DNA_ID=CAMNT_0016455047 /DNA_START=280 /DNA_END=564 /DNA_ORIENTATION=-